MRVAFATGCVMKFFNNKMLPGAVALAEDFKNL
jgi:hypothetical protein